MAEKQKANPRQKVSVRARDSRGLAITVYFTIPASYGICHEFLASKRHMKIMAILHNNCYISVLKLFTSVLDFGWQGRKQITT